MTRASAVPAAWPPPQQPAPPKPDPGGHPSAIPQAPIKAGTTAVTSDPHQLRLAMTDRLVACGVLPDPQWQGIFATVARHWFLTQFFHPTADRTEWELVDPAHPRWMALAHADATHPIQLDHDPQVLDRARCHGRTAGTPTRWVWAPLTSAVVLSALDVHDEQRALCLGDTTGYLAAVLAHRLTTANVVAVEASGHHADRARAALLRTGYQTPVFVGDPAAGFARTGPYDRVLAATPVERVPATWIEQAVPGAVIVAALRATLTGDLLVRLTVHADGTASGRFLPAYAPRPVIITSRESVSGFPSASSRPAASRTRPTDLHPDALHGAFGVIAALQNSLTHFLGPLTATDQRCWLLSHDGQSSASVDPARGEVTVYGPRDLWGEVEFAYRRWLRWQAPGLDRIGLTVTAAGANWVWLDQPAYNIATL